MKDDEGKLPGDSEEIRADNEILKLKLETEHGMMMSDTSGLPPQMENVWLNQIYDFEKQFKGAEKIPVYDFIKRPPFKPIVELTNSEVPAELNRLMEVMREHGVSLDCICEYEPAVIYKFVTEEFFKEEMDNIALKGLIHGFIYEEYHPNHDHDLRRRVAEFVDSVLERKWTEDFDGILLADEVSFMGKEFESHELSDFIKSFQGCYDSFDQVELEIDEVKFNEDVGDGSVKARLSYVAKFRGEQNRHFSGEAFFGLILIDKFWVIREFDMPGMG